MEVGIEGFFVDDVSDLFIVKSPGENAPDSLMIEIRSQEQKVNLHRQRTKNKKQLTKNLC